MKLFRILIVAALAIITSTSVQAGVVFSNMGNGGTLDTSGETNVNILPSRLQASGFTSGSTDQRINRISIVAETFGASGPKTLAIYNDNAGSPGRLLGKSNSTIVDAKGVYQFDFSGPQLLANTSYWLLPEDGMRWYDNPTSLFTLGDILFGIAAINDVILTDSALDDGYYSLPISSAILWTVDALLYTRGDICVFRLEAAGVDTSLSLGNNDNDGSGGDVQLSPAPPVVVDPENEIV